MISIARRLTRHLLVTIFVLLGAGLVMLYLVARNAAIDQFEDSLESKALAISTLTSLENGEVKINFTDRFLRGFNDDKARDFFQIWDEDRNVIARSDSLPSDVDLPRKVGTISDPKEWVLTLPSGEPGRAIGYTFKLKGTNRHGKHDSIRLDLVVAGESEDLDEKLQELLLMSVGVALLLIGGTLILIPRVLRRGLQPLNQLAVQTSKISAESLATRLPTESMPTELRPITEKLNALLERLEESFDRERRFSADLAHELRTPLSELRALAECALKWPESRDPATDREVLAIARQMEELVVRILALARGESGQLAEKIETLPLEVVVREVWAPFAVRASARKLDVAMSLRPVNARVDAAMLRSILTNLFDNAIDYSPTGGQLAIAIDVAGNDAILRVSNAAPGLESSDVARLFDRFWRKEAARSGGKHVGIGLSLCQAFASAMHWKLTAALDGQGRLVFTLRGPASETPPLR